MHTLAGPDPAAELPGDEEVFVFPLSFAQQRLWFIDQMEPGNPFYNVPAPLLLEGALDPDALERALGEIVGRHEALRTVFDVEEGEPVQVVLPARPFVLPLHDLSGWTEEERRAEVERRSAAEARRGFDLRRGPLFRAELLRLAEEEHLLLLTMHHVVSDGWSVGVLLRELAALYDAFSRGEESPLEPLPIQYADFAVWQRERLSGELLEAQLAYWRAQLADLPVLEPPADRPRPPAPSFRGGSVGLTVSAATTAALRELTRAEGATLFITLLAAWQTVLARWSGQEDVVVGTPIANRNRGEIEGLIGFFVNTLALRADLSGNPTFRELLRQVRERTFGAYAHQDLPFERVVEELRVERDPGRSPVFQVMFSLHNAPAEAPPPAGLRTSLHGAAAESAKYDLVLTAAEAPAEIHAQLTYAADLFDRETAERMAGHLAALLDGVAADPDARVAELPLMGADERRRVLEAWNATARDYPAGPPVHERIAAHAARTPGAPAVLFRDRTLSFAELLHDADALARRLRGLGVGPDSRVGLLLERSPETVAAVLGVLRAGGAYVALDPAHPDERLRFVLADTGAAVVVAHPSLAGRLAGFGGHVVTAPSPPGPLSPASGRKGGNGTTEIAPLPLAGEGFGRGPDPDNLAYVIYTSGSTGAPKGVLVTHRNLANYLAWIDETVPALPGLAFPLVSPLGFDAHVRQLFVPLLRGEPAWIVPDEDAGDPAALLAAVAERPRVCFGGVPSLWAAMLELVGSGEAPRPGGLVEVRLGGEALPPELAERTFALFPGVTLWNHYGPTETTVNATAARVRPGGPVTLGRPVGNARAFVLDARLAPAPVGVPGELYVAGAGVTRGYLGRPELTAERYLPDPFSGEPGARMYRSGDRVRWRADGELEYLGRVDRQVKVRGFRIELGEVEAALLAHPGVRAAAVVALEAGAGERRLAGYVVGAGGDAPPEAGLRDWLRARLPEYMVPPAIVALDALPLTPGGKLDPRRLPAPEAAAEPGGYTAPRTPAEEIVAGIWAEVLKRERVGAHDDFFESGGHSLLATRVVSRIRAAFGVEVPLRAIFEAPTVAGLAERVDAAVREGAGTGAPPLVRLPRDGPLPTSFAQQRLWFIQQMDPASAVYNMPYALRLRGALDAGALERALDALRARHESLRTTFALVDGAPAQVVAPPSPRPLPVEDLRRLTREGRDAAVRARLEADAAAPFDLERGPLLRAALLRLADDEWGLLLAVHHVVSDGWSTGILAGELSALYDAFSRGGEPRLPPLPVQYADYAAWQRAWLAGEELERQLAWWRARLAGAPPLLEVPTDRPRPPVQGAGGAHREFALPAETVASLRALSRREGATLFMTLLAGWQALLARYAGEEDVVVGTPIAGRSRVETEGLIGFFVNTLALRADLSGRPSARALLARVRETTLGAYAHQEIPFEKLVEELQPERSLAYTPLFQALFALQNLERGDLRLGALEVEPLGAAEPPAKFDLSLAMAEDGDVLRGALGYRTELWDGATAGRMLAHFAALLEGMAADPERPVAAIPLLSAAEREAAVVLPARPGRDFPAGLCIHELVDAQIRRTPDAVAVASPDARLTFAELDREAGRVARLLRAAGVGPEVRVGIFLERTPALAAALLGVLRAGGAYVPLDPAYPAGRLAYMLADSGARVLLTQEGMADRLPAFGGEVVVLGTPLPQAPSPARGEGEHGGTVAGADVVSAERAPPPPGPLSPASGRKGGNGTTEIALLPLAGEGLGRGPGPDNLAYVIYTSGSTGTPKGVAIRHRSAAAMLAWGAETFSAEERAGLLASTSVSFDISVFEIFLPLVAGGTAVLARNVLQLAELSAAHPVTLVNTVPSAWAELLRAGAVPPTVATVNLAGEPLPAALARDTHALGHVRRVLNLYGPSEDTTYSTVAEVEPGDPAPPIGLPLPGTRGYVLDAELEPVPAGVRGELYLAGEGLARGYLGRPELTAERWLPDPFGGAGERMYRTGDFVRRRPGGTLDFLARVDHQVKVRGFRIEPGEVEAALAAHPGVREAVVVVREDAPGDRRLVGYVVPAAEPAPPEAGLRAWLRERLPEHMVPAALVALEALPLTPSGKTDRRALPAPAEGGAGEGQVAPRDATEERLAAIWEEVLRRSPVGVHDDFFALGGHSLLVMQVVARVRTAFGVELPVAALFEKPTVAALAAEVADRGAQPRRTGPIRRADRAGRTLRGPG